MESEKYYETISTVYKSIGKSRLISLATCDLSSISCRTISSIIIDGIFYFQSDVNSNKIQQIKKWNNVAISLDNYQFVGHCKFLGHPFSDNNTSIMEIFKQEFPKVVQKYSHLEQELLVEFIPDNIRIWDYTNNGAEIINIDINNQQIVVNKLGY